MSASLTFLWGYLGKEALLGVIWGDRHCCLYSSDCSARDGKACPLTFPWGHLGKSIPPVRNTRTSVISESFDTTKVRGIADRTFFLLTSGTPAQNNPASSND